ncbi:P-loop containing nucleoside triphosphate hydrolase protein [Trametes coccinea BRFM310]|uniref:DNA 3'-5' helicase n=1 Tax=Trametes coccinea (strain BRFM310) TaxID=1353009 RepID=A0A1Y2J0Z9_TRAC3|nr:P-loop containing nucleoside triphosphate hydrolase protein [Trametes coccinea BRFM310]
MADLDQLMGELNPAQLKAVQHPPHIPLQILAGPGSGKTKVLTMRIAYLTTYCHLPPWSICAVTFTNKAANEMRDRLFKLLGKDRTAQIKMGTFHALCAMFLRRFAKFVGLDGNFTVCDADESKKIITKLLKQYKDELVEKNVTLTENGALGFISKVKAKGWTADDARRHVEETNALPAQKRKSRNMGKFDPWEGELGRILATIYKDYEKSLREANSLDFDDLLMFGVKLFKSHAKASKWCRHVLVDEFQDTNTMQYELMVYIARACQCVTIVGDPDQSIYGWRSAEIENLAKMQNDFPTTQQLYLEQNYRSTGSILALSMAIVSQDKGRIQKTLHASHPQGHPPVLRVFPIEHVEAAFIAAEIKRLVAYSGGMLNWGDFVVLLRFNSHSRGIESALQKEGIPNRVLAGHKFFERMEVKDLLAYLQLVDNPHFVPAFLRVVNVPSRTVGEKTVSEITTRAQQLKISPLQVVERIVDGKIPDIKPPVKKKLASFVHTIRILRKYANDGVAPSKLINALVDSIHYKEHLAKTQPDADSRWDNVQELINFASEVEQSGPEEVVRRMFEADEALHEKDAEGTDGEESQEEWEDDLNDFDGDQSRGIAPGDTPLRLFLQASMLSTDTETGEEEKSKEKVTIATCHAAKGLEWPVVIIPAVQSGVFPSSRAEDVEEERRLLYVACTRAKGLLYLTHTTSRMMAGEFVPAYISEFISALHHDKKTKELFTETLPPLPPQDRKIIATVIGRPLPADEEVARRVSEYEKTSRHPAWGEHAPFLNPAMGDCGPEWQRQQFPSAPYKGFLQQKPAEISGHQQSLAQPISGPASFSSSSTLLTATQRAGVVRTAAPQASSSRQVMHRASSSASQQPKAGPSAVGIAFGKPTSLGTAVARQPTQVANARTATHSQSRHQTVPSMRQSSAGSSKEEPIDIDALPSVPVPTRVKPLTTKPVTAVSDRPSASHRDTSFAAPRLAPTQAASTNLRLPPSPAPPLTYCTPPSPKRSLPSSASGSSTTGSSSAIAASAAPAAAIPPTGVKRRLGMGRTVTGYTNKKFKPVAPGAS